MKTLKYDVVMYEFSEYSFRKNKLTEMKTNSVE